MTATYESVFCTVTTTTTTVTASTLSEEPLSETLQQVDRRDNSCSTLVYNTVLRCSATGTTVTTSETATATVTTDAPPCGYTNTCTSCLGRDSGGRQDNINSTAARKRGIYSNPLNAPQRQSQPAPGRQATPDNYLNSDPRLFMRGETAYASFLGNTVKLPMNTLDPVVSSYVVRWRNIPDQIAIEALVGCMAFVFVSTRGALILHLFEYPAFATWDELNQRKGPRDQQAWRRQWADMQYKNLNDDVDEHWGGFLNFRSDADLFQQLPSRMNRDLAPDDVALMKDLLNNDAQPRAFVMAPVVQRGLGPLVDNPVLKIRPFEHHAMIALLEVYIRRRFHRDPNRYTIRIYNIKYSP
ncbi:hypothetical protein V8F20_012413, partial [Naviculisporaceae sp. PSN 640]